MSDEPTPYDDHYDATAGRGLCWNKDGKRVYVYEVKLKDGSTESVDTLWCFECYAEQQENCQLADKPC